MAPVAVFDVSSNSTAKILERIEQRCCAFTVSHVCIYIHVYIQMCYVHVYTYTETRIYTHMS
jgi:hypothetical protein